MNRSFSERPVSPEARALVDLVADVAGVDRRLIRGRRRFPDAVRARSVAAYLLRHELACSYQDVGEALGGRDHSSVMHLVGRVERALRGELVTPKGALVEGASITSLLARVRARLPASWIDPKTVAMSAAEPAPERAGRVRYVVVLDGAQSVGPSSSVRVLVRDAGTAGEFAVAWESPR